MFLYYTLKSTFAAIYLYMFVVTWRLFFQPLIDLYGGWTLIGYWLGIFFVSMIASVCFLILPRPTKPQATPKQ